MHGRKMKIMLRAAIACAVAFCWMRPVAALADAQEVEEAQSTKSYQMVKDRLVYIEMLRVKSEADCTKQLFENTALHPNQGTGYLLTSRVILTALHVAGDVEAGEIRCFGIRRATDKVLRIARPPVSLDMERPGFFGPDKDLTILRLQDEIADPALTSCPAFLIRPLERGKIVFINGYDGATIKFGQGIGVTDAVTARGSLLLPCEPGFLCQVGKSVARGISGAPVTDLSFSLVGVLKGGDNTTSYFEPMSGVWRELENICKPFNPRAFCDKTRAELENQQSFEIPASLRCNSAGQPLGATSYTADYPAPEGYRVSGFVTHKDNDIARVGHAEYKLSDDRLYVEGVRIELTCNGRPTASGKAEDAKTVVSGNLRKNNLSSNDKDAISRACSTTPN